MIAMTFIPSGSPLPPDTLLLSNTDDVLSLGERLNGVHRVALQFPKWTDGRAYSQAVLLRGRVKWTGELIATGDVVVDMAPLLRRCGFTAAQLRSGQSVETAQRTLGFNPEPYQTTLSERQGVVA